MTPSVTTEAPARKYRWTFWQVKWGGLQLAVLLGLLGGLSLLNSDTNLLFTTALGHRLLVQSAACLGGGLAVGLLACLALDVAFPGWQERHPRAGTRLRWALGTAQVVLFFLPAAFVAVIGPSVIQITQAMQGP